MAKKHSTEKNSEGVNCQRLMWMDWNINQTSGGFDDNGKAVAEEEVHTGRPYQIVLDGKQSLANKSDDISLVPYSW
jgi:hypothetical protein